MRVEDGNCIASASFAIFPRMKKLAIALCIFSVSLLAAQPPKSNEWVLTEEDNNFALGFSLESGGSMSLIANCDKDLKNGVEIEISRQEKRLRVILQTHQGAQDISEHFVRVDASQKFNISVDVHGHGHVMIDGVEDDELEFAIPRVRGEVWALKANRATIFKAVQSKAKHQH